MCEFTLFFYGTLRAAEIRSAVLGYDLPTGHLTDAVLENYQVRRVKGALYPLLVPAAGEKAIGLLATSLDRLAIEVLDQFEGHHYNRSALQVHTAAGFVEADVYLPDDTLLAAESWDFDRWYKHDMTAFLQQDFRQEGVRPPSD